MKSTKRSPAWALQEWVVDLIAALYGVLAAPFVALQRCQQHVHARSQEVPTELDLAAGRRLMGTVVRHSDKTVRDIFDELVRMDRRYLRTPWPTPEAARAGLEVLELEREALLERVRSLVGYVPDHSEERWATVQDETRREHSTVA